MEELKINGLHIDVPLLNISVKMEVIEDELKKNGVHIDVPLLNIYINRILTHYKELYDEATNRLKSNQLIDVFIRTLCSSVGYTPMDTI